MFKKELYPHQQKALTEALACMNTLIASGVEVDAQAVDTIRAMLGIRGTMDESMNKAIASMVEDERRVVDGVDHEATSVEVTPGSAVT